MRRDTTLFTLTVLIVVVGLVWLLYAEFNGMGPIKYVGGAISLLGVAIMTGAISRMDEPDGASH